MYDPATRGMKPFRGELRNSSGGAYFETSAVLENDEVVRPFRWLATEYARRYRARERDLVEGPVVAR